MMYNFDESLSLVIFFNYWLMLGCSNWLLISCSFHPSGSQAILIVREGLELSFLCESISNRLLWCLNGLLTCEHLINIAGVMS